MNQSNTVTLYNFVGEINDTATYTVAVLRNVSLMKNMGTRLSAQGKQPENVTKLYLFDNQATAELADETEITYLTYEDWVLLSTAQKALHWTLSDKGDDYFSDGVQTSAKPNK